MVAAHPLEVPAERLRQFCDPAQFHFETTSELASLVGTIGQPRATTALDFGLGIRTQGYNVFAAGLPGTGKLTTVVAHVNRVASGQASPPDWCYVHNFDDPYRPAAVSLPAGRGSEFARDVDELVEGAKREIPRAFESENYEERRSEILREVEAQRDQLIDRLHRDAAQQGLAVQITPIGILVVPQVDGRPMTPKEFDSLPEGEKRRIRERGEQLQTEITQTFRQARRLEREAEDRTRQLDREVALFAIGHLIEDLRERYQGYPRVVEYIGQLQNDIVEHLADFRKSDRDVEGLERLEREDRFRRYRVNTIVDNSRTRGAPVVVENSPTYYNLFGRIEYRARLGAMTTDFSMVKAGALHQANGGYLIVQARDVLLGLFVWETLKRHLRSREIQVENIGEQFTAVPAATIRPEPIPLDVKIVMIGHPLIYYLLYYLDEDFRKLFKVKADFDVQMERTSDHLLSYAAFVAARCREAELKHFHRSAVARLIDYSSRLVEDQAKLTTKFIDISDTVTEASFWASKAGAAVVMPEHVEQAISQREFRSNLIEGKVREAISRGFVVVDTQGAVEAQVNGLSVSYLGDYYFGMPSRITARTALGPGRVINVERESKLSGRIHSKGFMILASYLAAKYGQNKPLALTATITFEQTYDEVEGDSASSTELYALLSSLAGVPLKQNLAVTGSVDQRGTVQAVGSVTRKVEGFFDVCMAKGLTGDQGVLIPAANLPNLMLRDDVVEAVREGRFHVYAVRTIDEGIELLTGVPAGEARPDGTYPEGTINYLVDRKLEGYAQRLREMRRRMPSLAPQEPTPEPEELLAGGQTLRASRRHRKRRRSAGSSRRAGQPSAGAASSGGDAAGGAEESPDQPAA